MEATSVRLDFCPCPVFDVNPLKMGGPSKDDLRLLSPLEAYASLLTL